MRKGKFVIDKSKDRQFYFHLKSGNGQIVLQSETYTTKVHALKGIAAIKRLAADAEIVDECT